MKLTKNFTLNKYGLYLRLVDESDADYILKLRTNPKLGKFLNTTKHDIYEQAKWIQDYKKREYIGTDYYFVYFYNNQRIGLNRIYNINGLTATTGSWICSPGLPIELPLLTVVIIREIFFEILGLEIDYMATRKDNKKVIKMHHLLGAKKTGENEIDVFHSLTKQDFKKNKQKFLSYINID